ncbi:NTP transferase domain-containing protein [Halovenus sp. WSH3]|uniref:NTP transferase domain-containing protein n=1 Tax=Halovenus carboxidivorans TaxID=2692199 RepID=A0A6B0TCS4_9EURY|nr:glycosyltransferase family 2 protein [Halovenus carboxidivorans]MXR50999.1 NTP transferase domain-containing protein [Halovenus carboxidivorans]
MRAIMPVAGLGSRFATVGISKPKPLIEVGDKPMVRWAADSIPFVDDEEFVFVARQAHVDEYDIDDRLREIFTPAIDVVAIDYLTEGPACTAALAREHVDDEESVIVTDSDHYFESEQYRKLLTSDREGVRGAIPVFKADDDGLSYSAVDEEMHIQRVAEKDPISRYANIGAYYFDEFGEFRSALEIVQKREETVNNEYYVAPLYNEFVDGDGDIVACECETVWSLGTPDAVERFESEYLNSRREA